MSCCIEGAATYMKMAEVVQTIDELTNGEDCIVTTGVGSHQQIVAREFAWDYPRRMLITSAGHGTMGAGLPYAIGAAICHPDVNVICFNGDGSMSMDMVHLPSLIEHDLNIKVVVLDNGSMGIVRQFEDLQDFRHPATIRPNPGFAAIAEACGVRGYDQRHPSGAIGLVMKNFMEHEGPALAHVAVDDYAVWPILEGGERKMTHEP
jgi:acetolactate synthase-1/2/3 large subunit